MRFPVKVGFLIGSALVALSLLLSGQSLVPAQAQTPTLPPPAMPTMQDRLAAPPTVYPPTQADQGAQVYWFVCMVCHGDRGQGLTDEWRMVGGTQDQNCWQSKCHAPNHPPQGFVFQKYVPPVIAPGLLTRFATALDLHDFIQNNMPWQAPGTLSPEEYWQLTAFLLRANGYNPGNQDLDPQRAVQIPLRPYPPSPPTLLERLDKTGPWAWGAALFILVGIALAFLLVRLLRR
jgi:mono/diheme cytochrome c family protein